MDVRTEFLSRYKKSLLDSVRAFSDADLERHVDIALQALSLIKPKLSATVLTLVGGRSLYPCPANLLAFQACFWGRANKAAVQPWDDGYVGKLPEWSVTHNEAGERFLRANPPPSFRQLSYIGSYAEIEYRAAWDWEDVGIGGMGHVLMLRAQAEAMRELAAKNATTAYNIREGISATPKNGTPAYLYEQLLQEFERLAGR